MTLHSPRWNCFLGRVFRCTRRVCCKTPIGPEASLQQPDPYLLYICASSNHGFAIQALYEGSIVSHSSSANKAGVNMPPDTCAPHFDVSRPIRRLYCKAAVRAITYRSMWHGLLTKTGRTQGNSWSSTGKVDLRAYDDVLSHYLHRSP